MTNVKPAKLVPHICVLNAQLTELTHLSVNAKLDSLKILTVNAFHVLTNVSLVHLLMNVVLVLETESTHLTVSVHMVLMMNRPLSVHLAKTLA